MKSLKKNQAGVCIYVKKNAPRIYTVDEGETFPYCETFAHEVGVTLQNAFSASMLINSLTVWKSFLVRCFRLNKRPFNSFSVDNYFINGLHWPLYYSI